MYIKSTINCYGSSMKGLKTSNFEKQFAINLIPCTIRSVIFQERENKKVTERERERVKKH